MIIILLIVYIVNLFGCFFYCHRQKKKIPLLAKTANNNENDYHNLNNDFSKSLLRQHLGNFYNRTFSGLLRVNLAFTSIIPSHHIRMFLYRHIFLMNIEKNVVIYYGTEIRAPWMIAIGEGTIIGDKAILDGRFGIQIGKNVNFSTGVWLWTTQHDVNDPMFSTNGQGGPIIIEDRAWLSCRTTVLPGVKISEGSVLAAGTVVTKDTEPYSIIGGVPGKKIGTRNRNLEYEFDGRYIPFL